MSLLPFCLENRMTIHILLLQLPHLTATYSFIFFSTLGIAPILDSVLDLKIFSFSSISSSAPACKIPATDCASLGNFCNIHIGVSLGEIPKVCKFSVHNYVRPLFMP